MKLIRYDYPSVPSARDFDRLMEEFLGAFPRFAQSGRFAARAGIPADVYEDDANVHVRFELPGFKKEELDVQLENSVLTVSAERKCASGECGGECECVSRSVSLPDGLNAEGVSAKYEDGVLTVTLPRSPERKPRVIEIR